MYLEHSGDIGNGLLVSVSWQWFCHRNVFQHIGLICQLLACKLCETLWQRGVIYEPVLVMSSEDTLSCKLGVIISCGTHTWLPVNLDQGNICFCKGMHLYNVVNFKITKLNV